MRRRLKRTGQVVPLHRVDHDRVTTVDFVPAHNSLCVEDVCPSQSAASSTDSATGQADQVPGKVGINVSGSGFAQVTTCVTLVRRQDRS